MDLGIIVATIAILLMLYAIYITKGISLSYVSENFVSKSDKAAAMINWLQSDSTPSYSEYYSTVGKNIESDILEYKKLIEYKSQNTNLLKQDELARMI